MHIFIRPDISRIKFRYHGFTFRVMEFTLGAEKPASSSCYFFPRRPCSVGLGDRSDGVTGSTEQGPLVEQPSVCAGESQHSSDLPSPPALSYSGAAGAWRLAQEKPAPAEAL